MTKESKQKSKYLENENSFFTNFYGRWDQGFNNNLTANIDGNITESEGSQILLGITIDSNLSF